MTHRSSTASTAMLSECRLRKCPSRRTRWKVVMRGSSEGAAGCADERSSDSPSAARFHLLGCCVLMRIPRLAFPLLGLAALLLAGCGTPGAPLPPTLDLPQPPTDLKATRKGDKVTLTWSVPTQTTDRALVKPGHLGATRVCR